MTEAPESIDIVLLDIRIGRPTGAGEGSIRPSLAPFANAISMQPASGCSVRRLRQND